ncbi:peptidoglycan DD-metalloendopeptidase family protein [Pontibacter sp. BT310]|uniref:Peptidoglycan DD-metalloendopeptidase family protein n=1 Tax=Pontibacter populi TaxID=890055 RepID=A0ABS6XDY5_9BACT|nr:MULTISPECIES: peptidoglycan DD-metalloendopeptidase family protein [Pontibacter]MBJ6118566.1 peptidoglycan DD-metalloendopeptidase family protein [Pontibacter sp. BT310]MBR0570995.1 peptidoglycan DD-metalloendopeptidase family protein [Microvirga sp. STS03]MBW3365420.1 peptidoglycan DD-metalloendopeptidase family protein [Pontibacter populi]
MKTTTELSELLRRHTTAFAPVIDANLQSNVVCRLDFTAANTLLQQTDLVDTATFNEAVNQMLAEQKATIGVGGYFEDRSIYRRSSHFDAAAESRNLHLGIDIWMEAEKPIFTPLDAIVHSFQDNNNFGDYGPTIILQHELEGVTFYTLYGHLSRKSLEGLEVGKAFKKGDRIAWLGNYPENGDWPPHLHFQVMATMEGRSGDFPGVAAASDRAHFEQICPNPNIILQCPLLPL